MLINSKKTRKIQAPHYGQVGAGKSLPFIARRTVSVYWSEAETPKGIGVASVCGDSLIDVGINDGDELLVRTIFTRDDLKNGKLVIAELPCTGLVVKFFYQFEHKILLRSANKKYTDMIYDLDLIKIKAIVMKSVKNWES